MKKNSGYCLLVLTTILLSGCASVTDHLNRSMQDTYIASEVCRVIDDVVEVRSSDVKADIQELAESLLGLNVCMQTEDGTSECTESLHSLIADLDDQIHTEFAIAQDKRAKYKNDISELRRLSHQISDDTFNLRTDIRTALEEAKDSFGGACKSQQQCMRDYRSLVLSVIQVTDKRFYELSSSVRKLRADIEVLATALNADVKPRQLNMEKIQQSLSRLSAAIDQRWTVAKQLIVNPKWQGMLLDVARKVGLQEGGRLTVRMLDKGTQSVDRVLDRVDEKAWFVGSLAMVVYEADIRDELKKHFKLYYSGLDLSGKQRDETLFRSLSTAFVFASCEQLAISSGDAGKASTPVTGRGAYLLYPLFSAAVGGLYEHLVGEGAQLNSEDFRTKLVAWISSDEGQNQLAAQAKSLSTGRVQLVVATNTVQKKASSLIATTAMPSAQTPLLAHSRGAETAPLNSVLARSSVRMFSLVKPADALKSVQPSSAAPTARTVLPAGARSRVVIELPQREKMQEAVKRAIEMAL